MTCKKHEMDAKVAARARTVGGRKVLTCKAALKLAEELGVTPKTIGGICDRTGIKIRGCQLGCF